MQGTLFIADYEASEGGGMCVGGGWESLFKAKAVNEVDAEDRAEEE